MFITLQFPLFDRRYLLADASRTDKPDWPTPMERDRIRYFGEIISRNKDTTKEYKGPWDDEKKYCNARSVIDLCGTGKQHFYKQLHQSAFQSRIAFRRFQSDGKCLAKFEIGFNDTFEDTLDTNTLNGQSLSDVLCAHVEKYLLCPVKIRVGTKLMNFVPLIDAGRQLANAYYWATTKSRRSFVPKEMQNKVEYGEPAVFIQVDNERMNFEKEWQKIEIPELAKEKIQLYHQLISYTIGRSHYKLKAWIINLPKNVYTAPVNQREFKFYNETLRYLRINLLRIHVETVVQQKFLNILSRQTEQPITDQQTIIRLYTYLHKVLLNLSNINRNKQPQQLLVQTAFNLEETYAGAESLQEIIDGLQYYTVWLKSLTLTDGTKQVIAYLDKLMDDMKEKRETESNETTVFISYNHKDEAAAKQLKEMLEAKSIKVILDDDTMKAGTAINDFIGESLRTAQATIGIVSNNSLLSGWVAIETVNMLNFETLYKDKKWIACCLDEDFMQEGFIEKSVQTLRARFDELNRQMQTHHDNDIGIGDLQDEYARIKFLKDNLDSIVGKLKKIKYLSIAGEQLNSNFQKILYAISPEKAA